VKEEPMSVTRRRAILAGAAAAVVPAALERQAVAGQAAAAGQGQATGSATPPARARVRFAVSTYSYWHFKPVKYPIEKVIDDAAALGFEGVEILRRQMKDETPAYLNALKKAAFRAGLALPMLSIHQDFVSPDPLERQRHVDITTRSLQLASDLGIPCVRLNSGRWKTIQSFDDLMKVKGDEPPLPGHTLQEAIDWCVQSIEACLPLAERLGVMLALENHWGLTTRPENLLAIYRKVGSPWLGINLDAGNFPDEPYAGLEQLAPHAVIVQAKTYHGGGEWYTLDLDYPRIADILGRAGYRGWVSLEMEGKEDAATAVPKSLETLRKAFAA
jgi:L-ribulose-5-phosphate 3-epimerase